jgi:3-deoxy-manno-octulosonate cytidylyltransferase (CMP-KDO synthetase)
MYVIIPARYASTRLPGKALLDICGKPLLQHVYERALESGAQKIIVATDDARIYDAVNGFGGAACMTSGRHQSGTDRIAEVISMLNLSPEEIVVNLQGDEPLMPPGLIKQTAETLIAYPAAAMATACHAITDYDTICSPNVTKVVCDQNGYALYFSHAPIPWPRDMIRTGNAAKLNQPLRALRHVGLYAYRAGFVSRYAAWPPCPLEQTEALEQLRVLWYGERIAVCEARETPGPGVDTAADLEQVREIFQRKGAP